MNKEVKGKLIGEIKAKLFNEMIPKGATEETKREIRISIYEFFKSPVFAIWSESIFSSLPTTDDYIGQGRSEEQSMIIREAQINFFNLIFTELPNQIKFADKVNSKDKGSVNIKRSEKLLNFVEEK